MGHAVRPQPASDSKLTNLQRAGSRVRLQGALFLLAAVAVAVAPWWNRYLALTNDGWHFFFGDQIAHGLIPYRDFYLFSPPLLPLENAAFIKLFGEHLIIPQLAAFVELLIIAVCLYCWLADLFDERSSFIATLSGIFVYTLAHTTEAIGSLHQQGVFFPVLAGFVASRALRSRQWSLALLSGVFAGASFLGKQTSGVAVTGCLGVMLPALIGLRHGALSAIKTAGAFAGGWLVPLAVLCTWLLRNHALRPFIEEVFVKGSSSKGTPVQIITRPFSMIADQMPLGVEAVIAAVLVGSLLFLVSDGRSPDSDSALHDQRWGMRAYLVAALSVLLLALVLSNLFTPDWLYHSRSVSKDIAIFFGEFGSVALFFYVASQAYRRGLDRPRAQQLLLAGLATSTAYVLSFSWAVYIAMAIPAFSFTLAYFLSHLRGDSIGRAARAALIVATLALLLHLDWQKLTTPYLWGGWREANVDAATVQPLEPDLEGFRVSPLTASAVHRITWDIDRYSSPQSTVYAFPDLALFYVLSHRQPATFAYVHYIDVAPDYIDQADAQRLLDHPPSVIVYINQTEKQLRSGEKEFRSGNPSGERTVLAAINQLLPVYSEVDRLKTPTGDDLIVLAHH